MRAIIITVILGVLFGNVTSNTISCVSTNSFQVNLNFLNFIKWLIGPEIFCPSGYLCVETNNNSPCISESEFITTTTIQTTTACPTGEIGNEPTCSAVGVHPGPSCNQYYQCSSFLFFWYQVSLETCDIGEAFSPSQLACVSSSGSCECVD